MGENVGKKLTKEEIIAAKAAKRLEVLRQRREKETAGKEGFYTGFDTLSAVRSWTTAAFCTPQQTLVSLKLYALLP